MLGGESTVVKNYVYQEEVQYWRERAASIRAHAVAYRAQAEQRLAESERAAVAADERADHIERLCTQGKPVEPVGGEP